MNGPSHLAAPALSAADGIRPITGAPVAPLCVLLIEDDALIGDLLRELITDMGHYVCAVEPTEAGAVAAAGRYGPHLTIVDVNLADGGSGIAAIDRIWRTQAVPCLLMTGGTVQEGLAGGIVLRKPFSTAELHQAMQRALQAPPVRRIA